MVHRTVATMSEEEEGGGWRGPCDAPGCKNPTESSRFRPAKKAEHHGKQCCARSKCMEWAGHRDLGKERSARTAAKEAAKAATAAATAAQTMAGLAGAAAAVSPRRHTRAVPLPANAAPRSKILRKFEYTEEDGGPPSQESLKTSLSERSRRSERL